MTLSSGTQLGAFRIADLIGVGGMGEVYRAHDTRLGRDVALKVLPTAFRSDSERLIRFEREARALAAQTVDRGDVWVIQCRRLRARPRAGRRQDACGADRRSACSGGAHARHRAAAR